MRLIGYLETEKQAFIFYSFLLEKGIHSTYEVVVNEQTNTTSVVLWIYEEDEIDRAVAFLEEFKANPNDPKFAQAEFPEVPPQPPDFLAKQKEEEAQKQQPQEAKSRTDRLPREKKKRPFTNLVILVCALLFFWNGADTAKMIKRGGLLARQLGFTGVQQMLMFDYPLSNQKIDALLQEYPLKQYKTLDQLPENEKAQFIAAANTPTWKGIMAFWLKKTPDDRSLEGPLFGKIRQGEFWRLFSPALLHGSLLHILFNMAWVWILMPQIEERLSKWKLLLLIVIIGVIANIAQYFVSGPYFLGFSGIICGFVGFIWVRQKVAPWEGYPLQKMAIIFILVYIIAMFGIEIFTFIRSAVSAEETTTLIANTAHIVGGLCGALLGRFPFFARGMR